MSRFEPVVEKTLAIDLEPPSTGNDKLALVYAGVFFGFAGLIWLMIELELPAIWLASGAVISPLAILYANHRTSVLRRWWRTGREATGGREVVLCENAIRFADLLSTRHLEYQDERYDTIRLDEIGRVVFHVTAGIETTTSQYVFEMKDGSFRAFEAGSLKPVELEIIAWLEKKSAAFGFEVIGADAARGTHPKRSPAP